MVEHVKIKNFNVCGSYPGGEKLGSKYIYIQCLVKIVLEQFMRYSS